ncbi:proq activator of osmoprotectant transporter prop [Acidovorax carolinensis]|uniref:Proq activator of osmoprotectant transporter prop n=1 Tax=Acidovorax carolinensis TaxID=553814 RepID=A0A240U804_9BURK|nr:ProQ/FINO family protein [Acidovorax carolinensis]ART56417.1 proq activator of osmoprotectant transporter prop [Acidovorax carolinensis]ART57628.1 proq activator of osmoprotectant transporter prop [Acidovorax carolinensis]
MTDNVPEQEPTAAPAAAPVAAASAPQALPQPETGNSAPAPDAEAPTAADFPRGDRPPRGGRGGRNSGRARADGQAPAGPQAPSRTPPRTHPALEQLAGLYPHLFGAVFLPLKRGIFQDLLEAHPELFERDALKVALGIHTRSTRYLQSVAAGEKRHDLAGQPVEDMAPEHVHHALLEVFRRRKARAGEDVLPKLRKRMIQAFEASGLTREAYTELVTGRDEAANAILQEAFAEWAARNAKDEALLRAFEASGQTLDAFADMYGMDPRQTGQMLERARRQRPPATTA